MIEALRRIVLELNTTTDFTTVLDLLVDRVREAMHTEVCSVYIFDDVNGHFVLTATQGLNPNAVGKVTLSTSQGLVGLVGSREEPLNINNAPEHPNFHYISETGEAPYRSFLGVPIIHHKKMLGVLVVQQRDSRQFEEAEEAFLVTLSVQLAGVIAQAKASGNILEPPEVKEEERKNINFKGIAGAPGVGIGEGFVMSPVADLNAVVDHEADDIDEEIKRFDTAVKLTCQDIKNIRSKLSSELSAEELELFGVYLSILDDNMLGQEVKAIIRQGHWAQGALRQVIMTYVNHFRLVEDLYIRERASDFFDLGTRVLAHLQGNEPPWQDDDFPEHTILVGEELTPAMLAIVPTKKLRGLVSVHGSSNSHVAILARSMGIPTVMGIADVPYNQLHGLSMIVDGYRGLIYTQPSKILRKQYRAIFKEEKVLNKDLKGLRDLPAITTDGKRIPLFVNTGLITDVVRSLKRGAEGVGLYRTEVPFMMQERFPSESEQQQVYRHQLEAFAPNPVVMRTLDIGGDKSLSYFPIVEENPFLGWRGIRVTLDQPEIFLLQVRAMFKASVGLNNLSIMLPMISCVNEVDDALYLIHRAYHEVSEEGFDVVFPRVGVMIEVPAMVYQIKELCDRVDFVSVGSNDLTQYLLAVDRNNARVAELYQAFHPAVLKALMHIVEQAHLAGKQASVCGELAGDPMGAVLLLAMGYDSLSMNATNIPKVKSVIRGVSFEWATNLLEQVKDIESAQVVASTLQLAMERQGFSRFMGPAF